MTTETVTPWFTITTGIARKLGRNGGEIGFRVLRDRASRQLAITITSNSGGGCWSPEVIPLASIEDCLPDDRQAPLSAKTFARAFVGRSANNGPFATAVLLALGFLARAAEPPNRYQIADRWSEIKAGLLRQEAGEPYVPPVKASKDTASAMTRQEMPGEADTEEAAPGQKGRKGRPSKRVAAGDVHAASGQ